MVSNWNLDLLNKQRCHYNALIQYVEEGGQDMKLGSSFWALFMFIHIQINMFLSITGPIPLQGTSKQAGTCLNHGKHSPPHFSTLQRGLWMEDGLRLLGGLYFLGAPIKKVFLVIIIKYGFIYTITVAKASRVSKNLYADSRQICFIDLGWNLSQIDGKTPINFKRLRISLLGSEMHFCDVLSTLS